MAGGVPCLDSRDDEEPDVVGVPHGLLSFERRLGLGLALLPYCRFCWFVVGQLLPLALGVEVELAVLVLTALLLLLSAFFFDAAAAAARCLAASRSRRLRSFRRFIPSACSAGANMR